MFSIQYDLQGFLVTVQYEVEEFRVALESLFPHCRRERVAPHTNVITIQARHGEFSLVGAGLLYTTGDATTIMPTLEYHIRTLYCKHWERAGLIHSCGFCTPGGEAVLVLGPSGAGKTALVLRALAAGARGLSDELQVWDILRDRVIGYPCAYAVKERTLKAWPSFAGAVGGLPAHQWTANERLWYVDPQCLGTPPVTEPVRLGALVVLSRQCTGAGLDVVAHWQRLTLLVQHARLPRWWLEEGLMTTMQALTRLLFLAGGAEAILQHFCGTRPRSWKNRDT